VSSDARWAPCPHPERDLEWTLRYPLRHGYVYALAETTNNPIRFLTARAALEAAHRMNEPARAKEQA
jgi:hypothetical protein